MENVFHYFLYSNITKCFLAQNFLIKRYFVFQSYIFNSVSILLLIKVVIKRSHIGFFEAGLQEEVKYVSMAVVTYITLLNQFILLVVTLLLLQARDYD